jgi:hypothetical protein
VRSRAMPAAYDRASEGRSGRAGGGNARPREATRRMPSSGAADAGVADASARRSRADARAIARAEGGIARASGRTRERSGARPSEARRARATASAVFLFFVPREGASAERRAGRARIASADWSATRHRSTDETDDELRPRRPVRRPAVQTGTKHLPRGRTRRRAGVRARGRRRALPAPRRCLLRGAPPPPLRRPRASRW